MDDHPTAPIGSPSLSYIDDMLMDVDSLDDDSIWEDDIFDDPLFWEAPSQSTGHDTNQDVVYTGSGSRNFEIGSSSGTAGCDDHVPDNNNNEEDNQGALTTVPLQMWAPPQDDNQTVANANHSCSGCHVLREIVHTNGTHTSRFEIHGSVGFIAHAILQNIHASTDGISPPTQDFQILDFSSESFENIKEYLRWYLEDHRQRGYTLIQDPISYFYEALCVGFDWASETSYAQTNGAGTSNQGAQPPSKVPSNPMRLPAGQQHPIMPRTDLALQRERTKTMTIVDFSKYFDTPIVEAARQMDLCTTVIKRKVRSFKISRWPYRKVKSLKRKIELWSKDLELENPEVRLRAELEIERLQKQINEILSGNLEVLKNIPNLSNYDD